MRKVWLLLGGLLVGLLLAEVICRIVVRDPLTEPSTATASWRVTRLTPDPDLAYSFEPGYSGRMTLATQYDVPFRINGQGLRDEHEFAAEHPGVTRILLVGDSFAFGVGTELADTLGEQIETALNARPGSHRPVEVVAAGVPGYGVDDYARLIERWVPRLHPDLVLMALFTGNDLLDYELKNSDPMVVINGLLVNRRIAWSHSIRRFSVLAEMALRGFNPYERNETARPKKPTPAEIDHIYDTMLPWLARVAAAGPPVGTVVLYGRDNVKVLLKNPKYEIPPLGRVLAELRRLGVTILDPKEAWRSAEVSVDDCFFTLDAHHTAAGNHFLASWLATTLPETWPTLFGSDASEAPATGTSGATSGGGRR